MPKISMMSFMDGPYIIICIYMHTFIFFIYIRPRYSDRGFSVPVATGDMAIS